MRASFNGLIAAMLFVLIAACAGGGGGGATSNPGSPDATMRDRDGDGVLDADDNCPNTPNPGQENQDNDDRGAACDPDDNNNGFIDIRNATALRQMLTQDPDGAYDLTTNITLNATSAWQPVGTRSAPFTGTFDGRGHTIRNLRIATDSYSGLFGVVRGARLRGLNLLVEQLSAASSSSSVYAGGLAGRVENTRIEDVYVEARNNITARVAGNRAATEAERILASVGGLVGLAANSTVANSYALVVGDIVALSNVSGANVSADLDMALAGGLVGETRRSHFNNTYAVIDGNLSAWSRQSASAGGLLALGDNATLIRHSYAVVRGRTLAASMNATADTYASGLLGAVDILGTALEFDSVYVNFSDLRAVDATSFDEEVRTLAQLQCPTKPGDTCPPDDPATTYVDWDNQSIWNFGTNETLPIFRSILIRDTDQDSILDLDDNCPNVANRDQANLDNATGDRLGDACDDDIDGDGVANDDDNCDRVASANQTDLDNDGMGDLCDLDDDGDTINDEDDNCPRDPNPRQTDSDGDNIGNACDATPGTVPDGDNDTIPDETDNCPTVANTNQSNMYGVLANRSGTGDACEDSDGDGTADLNDNCPTIANPSQNRTDNCDDTDGDGTTDLDDNCPAIATPSQNINDNCVDSDGDGTTDLEDSCQTIYNPGQLGCADSDGDLFADYVDDCPTVSNRSCEPIANATTLQTIPKSGATGYYLLTANLTVNTTWMAIDDFRGVFNGSDHTIANLSMPLFSTISAGALVTRVGILDSTLASRNDGAISYTYATGNFIEGFSGGLVNENVGNISNSYAIGNISTSIGSAGGLVGNNGGSIRSSYATGDIGANGVQGGLVGQNGGAIITSYATGNVRTSVNTGTGGLVGQNIGSINNSYATGNAIGPAGSFGGLIGSDFVDLVGGDRLTGTINNSYRVQKTGNMLGDNRTLAQLRCPTFPGEMCQGETTYTGWSNITWNFGDNETLPTIRDLPACPSGIPSCRH